MRYRGTSGFDHKSKGRVGVLITNLGTPDAPVPSALRRYLAEFLSDPRVVGIPRLIWWFILHGIVLRVRPKKSAAAYKTVWTERGSPLLFHTQDQAEALEKALKSEWGDDLVVTFAMRYGNPSIKSVLQKLQDQGVDRLLVLPLYPQYSASTTASTFDAISADFVKRRWLPQLRFVSSYHDDEGYIDAMAEHIRQYWQQHGQAEKLVMSYHGIPLYYLHEGDPYHCHCLKTSRLLAEKLGLEPEQHLTTFQSRFGKAQWLQPYTDATLKSLPGQGVKSIDVFCPGFSADCLETIEEIGEENREYFIENGGDKFSYIPALNAEAVHIDALSALIRRHLSGWDKPDNSADTLTQRGDLAASCPHNQMKS